ncbi:MAG: glycosyltransferase, partial [Gammaproteobacteria bacterium]
MRRKVEATVRHKIAFFIPDLHMGGAERVFLTLSKQLSARGYEVEIVLANKKGELLAEVDPSVKIV